MIWLFLYWKNKSFKFENYKIINFFFIRIKLLNCINLIFQNYYKILKICKILKFYNFVIINKKLMFLIFYDYPYY